MHSLRKMFNEIPNKKISNINIDLVDKTIQLELSALDSISIDAELGSFKKEQKILSKGLHKDIEYNIY